MRSWILTGVAAFVMTVGSVPFVWDLVRSGMDVGAVKPRPMISTGLVAFFLAYLQLVSTSQGLEGSRLALELQASAPRP